MKILLLEDDYSLNKAITIALRSHGFYVNNFSSGHEAVTQLLQAQYDLCIFDINVPEIDGHNVLQFLRNNRINTPVIIMSVMKDIEIIKQSYDIGCDDYIKKPFDIDELILRINYLIKHSSESQNDDLITLKNGFIFDMNKMILTKNGLEIDLSTKEQLMLLLFIKNIGSVVTPQMLQEYVWNGETIEVVTIRSMIHKLKSKLNSGMIINLRGIGYKLLA